MITKIEIDGYKSFEAFSLRFKPFTVIAGINAVGKSNLFDALRHLSRLVSNETLREAFETERGSLDELFTLFPDGTRKQEIRYGAEMLLPEVTVDQFSEKANLVHRRVRYELSVGIGSSGDLSIGHERLTAIKRGDDPFLKSNPNIRAHLPKLKTGRTSPFIDTEGNRITISQDQNQGRKRTVSLEGAKRTVLSSITTIEFPHAYATRRALEDLHFLQLNQDKLRAPSPFSASSSLQSDGEGLAAVIARIEKQNPEILRRISNDLGLIVPGVDAVSVAHDTSREEHVIKVWHVDGYDFPSKLLSDGTLRLLALVTLVHDPEYTGTVILEEPENGVYPGRIPDLVALLKQFSSEDLDWFRPKQLIVNTHSVPLIRAVDDSSIVFASLKNRLSNHHPMHQVTEMSYVDVDGFQGKLFPEEDRLRARVAKNQLVRFLEEKSSAPSL